MSRFIGKYMAVIVVIVAGIALFFPDTFLWVRSTWINPLLMIVMFGMGLTLTLEDFKILFIHPKEVLIGCVAQFTLMPLLAFLLAKSFHLETGLMAGVILVGTCPGGTSSNVMTYLAKGNVPLSVGMTSLNTLLAPVLTPAITYLLLGQTVSVDIVAMMQAIVKVVLIPILLGLVLNRLFPKPIKKVVGFFPTVSVAAITLIVTCVVSHNSQTILSTGAIEQLSDHSVAENMEVFRRLKENYPTKRIIASIMGQNDAEWEDLARTCQENGADVIELNFSCPNMADGGLGSDIGQVPELVERFTAAARKGCTIPLLAKLTPNVANMSEAAEAAKRGGADGIAAINTIKSITNVNIHTYASDPSVRGMSAVGGYSGAAVKPIALRFVAELGQNPELAGMHLSGMGGIETWRDGLEFLMLGSGSLQVTTAVMQYGYRIISDLKDGLNRYLTEKGFDSLSQVVGIGLDFINASTSVLERDTIVLPKFEREICIGCGRCAISCEDGGHQAISFGPDRKPVLNGKRCVGCHLCRLVCPVQAISTAQRRITR